MLHYSFPQRNSKAINYNIPPLIKSPSGTRRVGFELEFAGIDLESAGRCITTALSGQITDENTAEQIISVPELGDFRIEMDWDFFKRLAKNPDADPQQLEFLRSAVSPFVPVEVVCPPVPVDNLAALDPMVKALRQAGARGTDDSLIAAFGVHINPELPELSKDCIENYLRAFALLQGWLVKAHEVDLSRRLTPYIDLYPDAYLKGLLTNQYSSLDELIDEYLEFNSTRNRALDMLPLFKELQAEKIAETVGDHLINARPTFHYRLPNCLIGRADWSLAEAWNIWCVIEELATRPDDLDYLSDKFISSWRPMLGVDQKHWIESIEKWLRKSELV